MHPRDRIRGELLLRGLSFTSIAEDLGLAYQTIYSVASGQRSRRVEAHIAKVLGKTVEEAFPGRYPEGKAR